MDAVGSAELVSADAGAIYDEVIAALEDAVGEPLYPGDERRIFGEAVVAVMATIHSTIQSAARQTMLRYARGEVLDALAARLGVVRLPGIPARTVLRFASAAAAETRIDIPAGTRATADGTVYFATVSDASIPPGETYVDVAAEATDPGTAGNAYPSGTVTAMVDLVPYVIGCSNVSDSAGGDDGEPYTAEGDDRLRGRVLLAPAKLSTAGPAKGYEYYAMSADASIADAKALSVDGRVESEVEVYGGHAFLGGDLIDPASLTVNGSASGFTATYADGLLTIALEGDLASAASVSASVVRRMDGRVRIVCLADGGEAPSQDALDAVRSACSASDVRPLTDVVEVTPPDFVVYDIEVEYWTRIEDEDACVRTVEGPGGAIERYVAEQGAKLGRDINPDMLLSYILRPDWAGDAAGAIHARVIKPSYEVLSEAQAARFSGKLKTTHAVDTGAGWS